MLSVSLRMQLCARLRPCHPVLPLQRPELRRCFARFQMAEEVSKLSEQPPDKMSTKDYRVYNSMAEHMKYFVFSLCA